MGEIILESGDELLLDAGPVFSDASEIVCNNLENIRMETHAEEREFMFAFQVVGACIKASAEWGSPHAVPKLRFCMTFGVWNAFGNRESWCSCEGVSDHKFGSVERSWSKEINGALPNIDILRQVV
jgi:hypothetical protein